MRQGLRTRLKNSTLALAFCACTASLGLAPDAGAQEAPASYQVTTNDGSTYQGQLVEDVVGQHVTIRLVSGEIRTFQASEVKSRGPVGGAVFAPGVVAPPGVIAQEQLVLPPPPLGAPGAPPVTYDGPDAVQVHVTKANAGAGTLFMESESGWVPVCIMPCSTRVDPKIDYRLYNSGTFRFPAGPPLDVVADTGGRGAYHAIGGAMIGLSAVGVLVGALVAADVFSSSQPASTPEERKEASRSGGHLDAGLAILGVSVAVLTTGIVFCALRPSSTLTTSTGLRLVTNGLPLNRSVSLTTRGLVF